MQTAPLLNSHNVLARAHRIIDRLASRRKDARVSAAWEILALLELSETEQIFDYDFLAATCEALLSDDWSEVGAMFLAGRFTGKQGHILMVAPYTVHRSGGADTRLTAFVAQVLPHDSTNDLDARLQALGCAAEPVSRILPIEVFHACGNVGGEDGEAFIVPNGWGFPDSEKGPALNDMREQDRRFDEGAKRALRTIFAPRTASLLIGAIEASRPRYGLRHREYQYHEAGHAAGLGLGVKLANDLLETPWTRGVEEWRSDGISFMLLRGESDADLAGRTVAANYALRFGVDAHRAGGLEGDTDVNAALLLFDALASSGQLTVTDSGQLELSAEDYRDLLDGTLLHAAKSLTLTLAERHLPNKHALPSLYVKGVAVAPEIREAFEQHVRAPAQGLYSRLR